jgi:hypothetical protein
MTLPKRFHSWYDKNLSDLSNLSLAVNATDSRGSISRAIRTLVDPSEYEKSDYKEILNSLCSVAHNTPQKTQQMEVEIEKMRPKFVHADSRGISMYMSEFDLNRANFTP